MKPSPTRTSPIHWSTFLTDVLICSLGAYGGPSAHFGVFQNRLVTKKAYLTDQELTELLALCSILPGPTSTQTLVSVGYRTGGPLLAFLTLLVWALPAVLIMGVLSFLPDILQALGVSQQILGYIGPLSVGFILVAAFRISRKVILDIPTAILWISAGVLVFFFSSPWLFPILLLLGGGITLVLNPGGRGASPLLLKPKWGIFWSFASLAIGSLVLSLVWDNLLIHVFEQFYRFGYLVFGGGQVVVPYMYTELVEVQSLMSSQEFLSGYGLVQGLPGPMFSFASYAGGMAVRGQGPLLQGMGALLGALGIFLPGTLLIFFVYPLWQKIRGNPWIQSALKGVGAVAGGMISSTVITILMAVGLSPWNIALALGSAALLALLKVPAPLLVLAALVAGILFPAIS